MSKPVHKTETLYSLNSGFVMSHHYRTTTYPTGEVTYRKLAGGMHIYLMAFNSAEEMQAEMDLELYLGWTRERPEAR